MTNVVTNQPIHYDLQFADGEVPGPLKIVSSKIQPLIQDKAWLSPHRKNYYILQYVQEGTGRHWVDMIPYEFKPGIIYFSTPEQVHSKENVSLTGTVILFTKEFLTLDENRAIDKLPLLQNSLGAHELIIPLNERREFEDLLDKCVREDQLKDDLSSAMLYSYIRTMIIYLSRLYNLQYNAENPNIQRDHFRRFQTAVEQHFRRKHEAADYADILGFSVGHLNAVIKQQSGKTVTLHIHERLILEAKRMLFSTNSSIKEITFDLGFRDASYFVRFFKRFTGTTPMNYRSSKF